MRILSGTDAVGVTFLVGGPLAGSDMSDQKKEKKKMLKRDMATKKRSTMLVGTK